MSFGRGISTIYKPTGAKLPDVTKATFGSLFAPAMFSVDWKLKGGWCTPEIINYGNLSLSPACSALHYGMQCFEGMKAYKGAKGEIRLFRPMENVARMQRSVARLAMPAFEADDLFHAIKELTKINKEWIPSQKGYSLYIRPTMIGTNKELGIHEPNECKLFVINSPVGPYYPTGFKPVKLMVNTTEKRAWPGGTGEFKLGANYAGPVLPTKKANEKGFHQVLWLGPENDVEEVGAMNFMVVWKNKQGERELITAPLDGTILPGVTRDCILQITKGWEEFKVTERKFVIEELIEALKEKRVEEMFGCGTAAIVSPVEGIKVHDDYYTVPTPEKGVSFRCLERILEIQYGGAEDHPWSVVVS